MERELFTALSSGGEIPPQLERHFIAEAWGCTPAEVNAADELDVWEYKLITQVKAQVAWARQNGGL